MITPPTELTAALETVAATVPAPRLAAQAAALRDGYRTGGPVAGMTREQAVAYAVYRLPATFAAVAAALHQVSAALPGWAPNSVLDLGGGSGAGGWAALGTWPAIDEVRVVDRDRQMLAVGRELATAAPPALRSARRTNADVRDSAGGAELVVASYCLGELDPADALALAGRLAAAGSTVVVVEPGTPRGFALVREIRAAWLSAGRPAVAPCPHDAACPVGPGDWCHFAARLPRSAAQRRAKGGERGYEDEKFSFVAWTSLPVRPAPARIVRHPQFRSGHVRLSLCRDGRIDAATVTRSNKALYRTARDAEWGDRWADDAPRTPST